METDIFEEMKAQVAQLRAEAEFYRLDAKVQRKRAQSLSEALRASQGKDWRDWRGERVSWRTGLPEGK